MLFNFTNANKNFDGKDKLLEWNWQITNEVKVIDNYNCRKAVSTAFGYDFTAWFTEEIPVNAGPEKFDGLPGLILFVQTAGIEYSVVSIKTEKKLDVIKPKIVANTFTMSEIEKFVKEGVKNFQSGTFTKTSNSGNTTTTTTRIITN